MLGFGEAGSPGRSGWTKPQVPPVSWCQALQERSPSGNGNITLGLCRFEVTAPCSVSGMGEFNLFYPGYCSSPASSFYCHNIGDYRVRSVIPVQAHGLPADFPARKSHIKQDLTRKLSKFLSGSLTPRHKSKSVTRS